MRILPDYNFRNISGITASSVNTLFPAANLKELDPEVLWKASAFSSTVTLTIDLGSAVKVDKIWLNNANFKTATIMANSSNSWSSPAVSKNVTLAKDDLKILKGFFALSSSSYRYVRVSIPVQTLENNDTVPSLGNIIIGSDVDFSPVAKWEPDIDCIFYTFTSDGGSYFKDQKTKPRHVFGCGFEHITKTEHKNLPLTGWNNAIIYTDLDDVSDSYLIYPPAGRSSGVKNPSDCSIEVTFEELV